MELVSVKKKKRIKKGRPLLDGDADVEGRVDALPRKLILSTESQKRVA